MTTERVQPKTAKEMMQYRDKVVSGTHDIVQRLGEQIKLVDTGEIQELIAKCWAEVKPAERAKEEGKILTGLRSLVPFGLMQKAETKVAEAQAKASNVSEIANGLVDSLVKKRHHVENIVTGMYELYDQLDTNYTELKAFNEGLKEVMDEEGITRGEMVQRQQLQASTYRQLEIMQEHMKQVMVGIETAMVVAQTMAAEEPSLRSTLGEGILIAKMVEDVRDYSDFGKKLEQIGSTLRETTREKSFELQKDTLNRLVIDDKALQAIEDNSKRQDQINSELASIQSEITRTTGEKLDRLKAVVDKADEKLSGENRLFIENTRGV